MPCQIRRRNLLAPRVVLLLLLMATGSQAHQSDVTGEIQAGSKGLVRLGVMGRWGFQESSPWYLAWQGSRTTVADGPANEGYSFGGEAGRENRRLSYGVRYHHSTTNAYSFTSTDFGLSLRLRFVPWSTLSWRERQDLDAEEKRVLIEERDRKIREAIPGAHILVADLDWLGLQNENGAAGEIQAQQFGLHLLTRIKPWIMAVPGIYAYGYTGADPNSGALAPIFALPSLRMVRMGPQGPFSGVYGLPSNALQLLVKLNLSPNFGGQLAFTRIRMRSPDETRFSYWLGVERRLGWDRNWVLSSAFELLSGIPGSSGYFTFQIRRELTGPFVPR